MTLLQTLPGVSDEVYAKLLDEPGVEFVDGKVVEKPMSSMEAAEIQASIISRLKGFAESERYRVFAESVSYRCYPDDPRKFRKPDASVIRAERLSGVDLRAGFCPIPADLAIEVVSPNDVLSDMAEKVEEYLQAGFKSVWVVEPRTRTVTIYHPDAVSFLREKDRISEPAILGSFSCEVGEFFAKP